MQIHEIFRKRTNEGVLKGVPVAKQPSAPGFTLGQRAGQIGKAVAHNLAGQVLQKAGLPSHGGETSGTAGFGSARGAAGQMNEVLIKHQAKQQMELWNHSVQEMMKRENISHPNQLSKTSKDAMTRSLRKQVLGELMRGRLGNDISALPSMVNDSPEVQKEAKAIVQKLNAAMDSVSASLASPNIQNTTQQLQQWEYLTRTAYQAMSLAQFEGNKVVQTLSKEEEAQRQIEIDKIKQELTIAQQKKDKIEKIKTAIEAGTYKADPRKIAEVEAAYQDALSNVARYNTELANSMMGNRSQQARSRPAPAAPTSPGEAPSLGGSKLDPNDPVDARILAALNKQGKI